MSRHDVAITLRQMLDYARDAMAMVRGRSRSDLDADLVLNRALVRTAEVIGEAAKRVPEGSQALYPNIPWRKIIGLRNRLIHAYDRVDLDVLWEIVSRDVPALAAELERIVGAPPLTEESLMLRIGKPKPRIWGLLLGVPLAVLALALLLAMLAFFIPLTPLALVGALFGGAPPWFVPVALFFDIIVLVVIFRMK